MRWWTRRVVVSAAVGLAIAGIVPLAAAEPPGTDAPATAHPTTTDPARTRRDRTTTTQTGATDTTLDQGQAERTTTTDKPRKADRTTTTTVPTMASGTWITVPGYNPEWRSINPPWLPRPPANSGFGRRIVYSKLQQRVWLMEENGLIANTHLVSGRRDIPAYGTYHVYSKSLSTFATHNPSITWRYMVRFAVGPQGGAIGLHEIPWQYGRPVQTVEQLGQPLSGGCLRQSHEDAVLVWNWAPVGTPVVVVP